MMSERRYEEINDRVVLRREETIPQSQLRRRLAVVKERIAELQDEQEQLEKVILPPDNGDDGVDDR